MKRTNDTFFNKTVVAFLCQGVGLLYEFLIMVLAGRLLGAKGYGIVLYSYTICSICMIVTKFGLENGLVSLIARNDITIEKKRWIVLFCLTLSLVLSAVMIGALYWFKPIVLVLMGTGSGNYKVLIHMAPIIVFETTGMMFASVIRGNKETLKYYIVYMHMQYGIRLVCFIVLWYLFGLYNIYALINSYYISYVFMIIVALYYLREFNLFFGLKERVSLSFIFTLSVPLMFSTAITVLNSQIDLYMIGFYLSDYRLAVYSMALNIGKVSSFALIAVNSIFAPMISEYYYSGRMKDLKNLYTETTKWVTCFNVLIMGFVSICAENILSIVGDEYAIGSRVLVIILAGETVNSMVGSVGYLNSMTGKASYLLGANMIAVMANIFLNTRMIPLYGIEGAAIASASATVISNILLFGLMYRHLGIQPYNKSYLGIPVALIIALIPAFLLTRNWKYGNLSIVLIDSLLFCVLFGGATYFIVCDREEREFIRFRFVLSKGVR